MINCSVALYHWAALFNGSGWFQPTGAFATVQSMFERSLVPGLLSYLVDKNFQTWHSCQPVGSHARKSLLTNNDLIWISVSNPAPGRKSYPHREIILSTGMGSTPKLELGSTQIPELELKLVSVLKPPELELDLELIFWRFAGVGSWNLRSWSWELILWRLAGVGSWNLWLLSWYSGIDPNPDCQPNH